MSALRFSRPGIAGTTLVDLGPSAAHSQGHRFYLLSEVTASRTLAPTQPARAGRTIRKQPYTGPRCGYVLPVLGEPCYRRPHGSRDHRSEASVKADLERRSIKKHGGKTCQNDVTSADVSVSLATKASTATPDQ